MDAPDNAQTKGIHLDLSRKPQGARLESFTRALEVCLHSAKASSTVAEAFDVIFGHDTAELLGFTKGYVTVVDVTEETVQIVYWINAERWESDGDRQILKHFAGIKRPTDTKQGRLVKYIKEHKESFVTRYKSDPNFSEVLRNALLLENVIVSPLTVFDHVVGLVLLGYPEYPAPEIQWMHEHLITYSALPVIQSFWFNKFREEIERNQQWRQIGQQAAALAHGIKSPMGAINLHLRNLNSHGKDPAQDERIREIQVQLATISSITKNLLSFVGPMNVEEKKKTILVRTLLEEALRSSIEQAKNTPISGNALDESINVDVRNMVLILRNLIDNAYESASADKCPEVEIQANGDEHELTIAVLDNGRGVPDEFKEKIFEPAYTTKTRGHGLGLAVALKFVTAHGGRMWVRDRKEGGTRFEVILPR